MKALNKCLSWILCRLQLEVERRDQEERMWEKIWSLRFDQVNLHVRKVHDIYLLEDQAVMVLGHDTLGFRWGLC